jgi:glutamate-1-semialdehyde 2,1-aminomutase
VPESYASNTLLAQYNSLGSVQTLFDAYGDDIAAVIIEPVAANMGVVPPEPGFLAGLRELVHDYGALLIFDEVITGFRLTYGSAQTVLGVEADITCLGKIIGGGLPVGAYGARREIMEMVAPLGPVYQAGTLSGNPLAMSAGLVTLDELARLGEAGYQRLEIESIYLEDGLRRAADEAGVPVRVNRAGSMLTMFFTDAEVDNFDNARHSVTAAYAKYFREMLARGVFLAPSQYEAMFVSMTHHDGDIEATIEAAEQSLRAMH